MRANRIHANVFGFAPIILMISNSLFVKSLAARSASVSALLMNLMGTPALDELHRLFERSVVDWSQQADVDDPA